MTVLTESRLPLPLLRKGKVREVYEVDADHLLLVASDRVSAFDIVMAEPIPRKGAVLTQLSAFWFERLAGVTASHYVTAETDRDHRAGASAGRCQGSGVRQGNVGTEDQPGALRVRGARLYLRLGVERIPGPWNPGRREAGARTGAEQSPGTSDLLAGHQGRVGPRHQRDLRRGRQGDGSRDGGSAAGPELRGLSRRGDARIRTRASSSPIPSSSSASTSAARCG